MIGGLKELLAKMVVAEPKEIKLSNTARLIRIGTFRTLILNGYKLSEGIVLDSGDRPTSRIEAVLWANSGGNWWKSGNTTVETTGEIKAYCAYNYNAGTAQSGLGAGEGIISTLSWIVGGGGTP